MKTNISQTEEQKASQKKYYLKNRKRIILRQKKYFEAHKNDEVYIEKNRLNCEKHNNIRREQAEIEYEQQEAKEQRAKRYYKKHQTIFRTYQRLVVLVNRDAVLERKRKYREKNRENINESERIRKAEKKLNLKYSEVLLQ